MNNQFSNKIIIVTGSTQGSGAETARLFAQRGAKGITICGRQVDKGKKIKEEIETLGTKCLFVDISKFESIILYLFLFFFANFKKPF